MVAVERLEDFEQRNVRLRDGFVEPALLEEVLVLRVAHEGEVRVQDEGEASARHTDATRPG